MDDTKRLRVVFTGDTESLTRSFRKVRDEAEETQLKMKEASAKFDDGVTSMKKSLKPLGLALGGTMLATEALGLVAAASFAIVGTAMLGATAAVIGLGLYGSDSAQTLKNSFHNALTSIKTDFNQTVKPFLPEFNQIATQTATGLVQAFQNFTPAITDLLQTMAPIMGSVAGGLGNFGSFMAQQAEMIINAFGSVSEFFTGQMAQGLKVFVNGLDSLIADLIKIGGPLIGPILTAFGNLTSSLGSGLLNAFNKNRQAITELVTGLIKLVGDFLMLIPPMITFASHFAGIINFIADHKWVIDALIIGFLAVKTAMFLSGAAEAFMGAMALIKGAWISFTALLEANPIILIIGAIILAGTLLITHWQQVKAVAMDVWRSVSGFFTNLWHDIDSVWQALVKDTEKILSGIVDAIEAPFKTAFSGIKSGVQDVENVIRGLKNTITSVPNKVGGLLSHIPGFAGGTDFAPGGLSLVGEQGPELVNLPRGSQVIPADKSSGMMGHGSVNLTVNVGVVAGGNVQDLAATIYRELQRLSRANGFNGALPNIGVLPTG